MIIVIDTNIWVSELGLNSHAGSALRFFMRNGGAQLALPEVIRLEVERHMRADLRDHVETIRKSHRSLLAMFGKLKDLALPTDADVEAKVDGFFAALNMETIDIPFSLESARAALLKTIDKLPPSDRNQQFKDAVVWADCVALLDRDDVAFVTSDTGFYRGRKYENGLVENLAREIDGKPHSLTLHKELLALLKTIETDIDIPDDDIAQAVAALSKESMRTLVEGNGFALSARTSVTRRLFITERSDMLFIECAIEHECIDTSGQSRVDAIVRQTASGMYDISQKQFDGIHLGDETLSFRLADGSRDQRRNAHAYALGYVGHAPVFHTVRYPLDVT